MQRELLLGNVVKESVKSRISKKKKLNWAAVMISADILKKY